MGKKIDKVFRDGLAKPDLQMQPSDWAAMERVLDKHQRKNELKSLVYIWLSGIAAMRSRFFCSAQALRSRCANHVVSFDRPADLSRIQRYQS